MNETVNTNPLQELVSKINPQFLAENSELITGVIKAFTDQQGNSSNTIDLEYLGIDDPQELYELLEVVPEYNNLLDDNTQLEEEHQLLLREVDSLKKENLQLRSMVRKAKKMIQSFKQDLARLENEKLQLTNELQAKDNLMNNFRSINN